MPIRPLLLTLLTLCAPLAACAHDADLVIHDVTLIDTVHGRAIPNRTVVVEDGRIQSVSDKPFKGTSRKSIDGRGKFLMPGLIDAHCHPSPAGPIDFTIDDMQPILQPMVRFGVTSALFLGGSVASYENMDRLKRESESGALNAPRIFNTSPIITIEGAHPVKTYATTNWIEGETILIPRTGRDIDAIMEEAARQDVVGVKITVEDGPAPPFIEPMPASWVKRFVHDGDQLGLPVYAHVSDMPELRVCVDAGVHAVVHLAGVAVDWNMDADVINQMIEQRISWVTTLVLFKGMAYYPMRPEWLDRDILREAYSAELLDALKKAHDQHAAQAARELLKQWTGDPDISEEDFFAPDVALVAEAHRRGVNIVLGTDTGNHCVFPGFSLHEEMHILQRGGIAPADILKMGTVNAAHMLGKQHELGAIEPGKRADFVLLTANPIEDTRNALHIERVYIGGVQRHSAPISD